MMDEIQFAESKETNNVLQENGSVPAWNEYRIPAIPEGTSSRASDASTSNGFQYQKFGRNLNILRNMTLFPRVSSVKLISGLLLLILLILESAKLSQIKQLKKEIELKTNLIVTTEIYGSMASQTSSFYHGSKGFQTKLDKLARDALRMLDTNRNIIDKKSTQVIAGMTFELNEADLTAKCIDAEPKHEVVNGVNRKIWKWCWNEGISDCRSYRSYHGNLNTTRSGLPCVQWSDKVRDGNHPEFQSLDHNFCRMQTGNQETFRTAPWCFVKDAAIMWDYCFPACSGTFFHDLDNLECYNGLYNCWNQVTNCSLPDSYTGTRNKTLDNRSCKFWDTSGSYPNADRHAVDEAGGYADWRKLHRNYCRIWPSYDSLKAPWCVPEGTTDKEPCFHKCTKRQTRFYKIFRSIDFGLPY